MEKKTDRILNTSQIYFSGKNHFGMVGMVWLGGILRCFLCVNVQTVRIIFFPLREKERRRKIGLHFPLDIDLSRRKEKKDSFVILNSAHTHTYYVYVVHSFKQTA